MQCDWIWVNHFGTCFSVCPFCWVFVFLACLICALGFYFNFSIESFFCSVSWYNYRCVAALGIAVSVPKRLVYIELMFYCFKWNVEMLALY